MDVRYINPFVAAIKNVFSTMVNTEIKTGKPYVVPSNSEPCSDVSAVIGLSGDVVGCVVLSLPLQTACNTASRFAGIDMDQTHEDFTDALGELANMVAGHAKSKLEGLSVSISLPSVIIGRDHVVSQSRQRPRLLLPCESDLGPFQVEVAMVIEKESAQQRTPAAAGAGA